MRTIYAARVAGAGLSLVSGLFLLSLLFTQGGCTAPQARTGAATVEAPNAETVEDAMPMSISGDAGAWMSAAAMLGSE
jgi:hypothetical protein